MPRCPRVIIPGLPHHFTQRGNARQQVFDTDRDRHLFLRLLAQYATKYELEILGYCLMPNHYHLIAIPHHPNSAALALGRLHADYARIININRDACGHLWQSRYHSVTLDPTYTWRALAYVERNPVRANIVPTAQQFPWSSAPARLGITKAPQWLSLQPWSRRWSDNDWHTLLKDFPSEPTVRPRLHALGRPRAAALAAPAH